MERISAWRFINPPLAWAQGIIVNGRGERYCDEMVYGSLLGERMCEDQEGRAILIIDKSLFKQALNQILRRTYQAQAHRAAQAALPDPLTYDGVPE